MFTDAVVAVSDPKDIMHNHIGWIITSFSLGFLMLFGMLALIGLASYYIFGRNVND